MADDTPTTVVDEPPASEPSPPDAPALGAGPDPIREARWTRLILPIVLPVGAAVMIAVFVLNVSRVFLATGSFGALVLAVTLIVVILGGAAGMSAAPRLRTSSLVMMVSGLFIAIMSAGLVAGPVSVEEKASGGGFKPPTGPVKATLEVDALPTLKFQAAAFTIPTGVLQINYVSKGGNHTLAFDPPGPQGFQLDVPSGGTVSGKVLLKPGQYQIFCTIPGHRAQGMQATLTVQ